MRDAAIDPNRSRARGAPSLDGLADERPTPRAARPGGITSAAVAAQRLGGGRERRASNTRARSVRPSLAERLSLRLPRVRPVKALTVATFGVALVGIVANAMVFQKGHRAPPPPGLGQAVDGKDDAAARAAVDVPPPAAPAPAAVERTGAIAPPAPAADPAPAAAAPKPAHRAAKPHHDDATRTRPAAAGEHPPAGEHAAAHPRPGRPAAAHAAAAPAKADPVAKLLAEPARAKADSKPSKPAAAKPDRGSPDKAAAAAAKPHHRLAAAPAAADKPAKADD